MKLVLLHIAFSSDLVLHEFQLIIVFDFFEHFLFLGKLDEWNILIFSSTRPILVSAAPITVLLVNVPRESPFDSKVVDQYFNQDLWKEYIQKFKSGADLVDFLNFVEFVEQNYGADCDNVVEYSDPEKACC